MRFRAWLSHVVEKVFNVRRATTHVVAASLTTVVASGVEAQAPHQPVRPAGTSSRDTVHRYHEKFVLTPSDSVVIRADTVWYPRAGGKALPLAAPSAAARTDTATRRPATPATRGHVSHASHASHASHSSHRSMVGYRSGY